MSLFIHIKYINIHPHTYILPKLVYSWSFVWARILSVHVFDIFIHIHTHKHTHTHAYILYSIKNQNEMCPKFHQYFLSLFCFLVSPKIAAKKNHHSIWTAIIQWVWIFLHRFLYYSKYWRKNLFHRFTYTVKPI